MIQNPLAASMIEKPMQSAALNMNPQMALPEPPKNALMQAIGGGLNAFRKSFDPEGYKASQAEAKAAEGDKLKQTLALMQQQRALPEAQRGQWWQQNAPTISKIIGQDVSQMPLDVTKFSDQALDGQIAALSAQAGIGPVVPEQMSPYEAAQIRLKEQELAAPPKPGSERLTTEVGANGNFWSFNTATGKMEDTGVKAPAKAPSNGVSLAFGEGGALAGLSIGGAQMPLGGDGAKGKGPAVIAGPGGEPRVSPGQQQLTQNKDWQRIQSQQAQSDLVRGDVKKAIGLVKPETTGALASTKDLPFFGGSTASGRLANALATIKANVGFDNLQTMRDNSPTGGALGAVTEKEIAFLQAMQGSLEQSQTAADLKANLQRLDQFFAGREQRRREAFAQDYPELAQFAGFAQRTQAEVKRLSKDINKATAEYNALPSGASYIDDDGIQRTKK